MLFALLFLQSKTITNKQDKHHILVVKLKFVAHFQIFGKNLTLRLYTHQPTNFNQLDPIHIFSINFLFSSMPKIHKWNWE
jgi:hypothetical protein